MRARSIEDLAALVAPDAASVLGDASRVVGPDVVIDNRSATPGSLFVALPGARVDGHDFAAAAVEAGAAAVLGTRDTGVDVPHLIFEDSVQGLSWLARGLVSEARARGLLSIGITGSSGKTSTKDLLAQLFERLGPTVSPHGSQNNEIGVPLTACRITDDTRHLVSEMGSRGIGHIKWLTSLVGLDIAVVLNVGTAHVGEFGGVESTAAAKSELVADLSPQGWAVLNADDTHVAAMAQATRGRIAWYGTGDLPEGELLVTARDVTTTSSSQPAFELVVTRDGSTTTAPVQLQVVGRHQVHNALAAAAAAIIAGMPVADVAIALGEADQRSEWRMALARRSDGVIVVNDAYNANPESVSAALRTAAELGTFQRQEFPEARVVAVLGDMLELGPTGGEMHAQIGRLAADLGVQEVIAVGEFAPLLAEAAAAEGVDARVEKRQAVVGSLGLRPGDVVLVKGSRGIGLETVAAELIGEQGVSK